MTKTVWRCEQLRAGQVTNQVMFATQREAKQFQNQMIKAEPDLFWRIEAVPLATYWN